MDKLSPSKSLQRGPSPFLKWQSVAPKDEEVNDDGGEDGEDDGQPELQVRVDLAAVVLLLGGEQVRR